VQGPPLLPAALRARYSQRDGSVSGRGIRGGRTVASGRPLASGYPDGPWVAKERPNAKETAERAGGDDRRAPEARFSVSSDGGDPGARSGGGPEVVVELVDDRAPRWGSRGPGTSASLIPPSCFTRPRSALPMAETNTTPAGAPCNPGPGTRWRPRGQGRGDDDRFQ
jgi:hypothetical protein